MSDTSTPAPDSTARPPSMIPGGALQSEPDAGLRDDDFGLGGDMRQQLVDALTARFTPDGGFEGDGTDAPTPPATPAPPVAPLADPSSTPPPTPPADTAATPAPAPEASPTPDSGTGQDGAGGGGAADATPAAGDDATAPPAPAPGQDDWDFARAARDYFGTDLTREQSQELFGLLNGLQSLTPQQRARLDQILAGNDLDVAPVTAQPYTAPGQPQLQPQPAPQQPTVDDPAVSILGPRPDDDYLAATWDMNARAVRAQQQQLAELQANIDRQTQLDQQRQRDAWAAEINRATTEWRESHKLLNDEEYAGLYARAEASGQFPALVQAHHGNISAAFNALMEQHFWADPRFRDRAMANAASGRNPMDPGQSDPASPVAQQQAETEAGRRALAASVAGGGGTATPPPGSASTPPTDPSQKRAAMVAELQGAHDWS